MLLYSNKWTIPKPKPETSYHFNSAVLYLKWTSLDLSFKKIFFLFCYKDIIYRTHICFMQRCYINFLSASWTLCLESVSMARLSRYEEKHTWLPSLSHTPLLWLFLFLLSVWFLSRFPLYIISVSFFLTLSPLLTPCLLDL